MAQFLWIVLLLIPLTGFLFLTAVPFVIVLDKWTHFELLLLVPVFGGIVVYLGNLLLGAFQKDGGEMQEPMPFLEESSLPLGENPPGPLTYLWLAMFGPLAIFPFWKSPLLRRAPISVLSARERKARALTMMLIVWSFIIGAVGVMTLGWNGQLIGLIGLGLLITAVMGLALTAMWLSLRRKKEHA